MGLFWGNMQTKGLLIMLVCIAMSVPSVQAQELDYNIYDFKIRYGTVLVVQEMVFSAPVNLSYHLELPQDAKGIFLTIDNENLEPVIVVEQDTTFIPLDHQDVRRIRISYITEDLLDGQSFVADIKTPFPTSTLQARL